MGILLVYDVTNRASFNNLERWLNDVRSMAAENLVVVVVGNKTDLVGDKDEEQLERQVSTQEGRDWAEERGDFSMRSLKQYAFRTS